MKELKIGPILTVNVEEDYIPTMSDAYQTDNERGSHWLNAHASDELSKGWPTVIAMAPVDRAPEGQAAG